MSKVSVVIPAFNCAATIERTINSVLSQTVSDYEIIVINDGSTDETIHILEKYGDKIKLFNQANQGVAEARNKGVALGTGEFIAFLDADDEWYPHKLEKQLELFDEHPELGLVSSAAEYLGEWANTMGNSIVSYSGNIVDKLLYANPIVTSSVLVRRSNLLQITPLFCKEFQPSEDWQLWIRFASRFQINVSPEILIRYHVSPIGLTMKHSSAFFRSLFQSIYKSLLKEENLGQMVRDSWMSLTANTHLLVACISFDRGETLSARREVLRALMISPRRLKWKSVFTILLLPRSWRSKLRELIKKRF